MQSRFRAFLILCPIVVFALAAHANEHAVGAAKTRMDAMTDMGRALRTLTITARTGRPLSDPQVQAALDMLEEKGAALPDLFAEPEIPDFSESLPDIWEQPEAFSLRIETFSTALEALGLAHALGDPAAFSDAVRGVNGACDACHRAFRR